MGERLLRVAQVNTLDFRGGAAQVAWNLHRAYAERGIASWMAVKRKSDKDPRVITVPNEESRAAHTRLLLGLADRIDRSNPLARRGRRALCRLAEPGRWWDWHRGIEDFRHPGSWRLLEALPERPDLVHCHNLHGAYFDLRALARLTNELPVMLTLHDAWLLSGHCAHSFDCERWRTGCGDCPDLSIYPAVRRDATASNWRRKEDIFARSRLYVATPCRWLMRKVESSMLAPAVVDSRVIPYGIDLSLFRPGDKQGARVSLNIPPDARVLLFTADSLQHNIWKDYETARAAVTLAAERLEGRMLLIALGEAGTDDRIGRAELRCVPYEQDRRAVARYYQAADVYMHSARADTFPNAVLEALACGTPVVATSVGGIPEQVRPLEIGAMSGNDAEATGALVEPGDVEGMARAIAKLLADADLRSRLGKNAAADARRRFDLYRQVDDYLTWYTEILQSRGRSPTAHLEEQCVS